MLEQELALLGLLKESPKHGYEIKRKVKEMFSLFAGAQLKSIYYPLAVLEKQGLVIKQKARQGRRPQRWVYSLTPKGQQRFHELLDKSFMNLKRPYFSLDISLYFLGFISPEIAKRRLRGRMRMLRRLAENIAGFIRSLENKKGPGLVSIMEHDLRMVNTEYDFLAGFIRRF
jgi:DNA-binding PadR family transcriptional regulator